ncbi:MAG: APC family permease [Nocardiopsaceae bacterium]|jgi:amino acid transporter|nr:APC family permease [Nocardiopsaceae bacterium]
MAQPAAGLIEHTTELAVHEKSKLFKSLRRFDLLLFLVCAIVGLDTLGQVSSYGAQTFTWVIILAVVFLFPYALVMAELGSAFTQEGGPYEWMKLAWGRLVAGIGAVLYWVTNPLWVGGSLAFIATEAWSTNYFKIGSGSAGDYIFKTLFIWVSIGVAIAALRYGKWIPNFGAIVRFAVLGFFSVTILIYAIKNGVHGYAAGQFAPSKAVFIGLVPLLLFNYVGFELGNGAAEEMENPQRDVPRTVAGSGILAVVFYAIPIFGILAVLPVKQITGVGGFLDAVNATFSVYGGAQGVLVKIMAAGFIIALVTSGAVWMIGSDRVQAVAGYDGAFAGWFGVFNRRFGTPVRVNVMSGIAATIFMIVGVSLNKGSTASTFVVVLYMAISTTLISYIAIFPTVIKLRYSHPHVPRPYRVPFGNVGVWIAGGICTVFILLASFVAVFPDVLEKALGAGYNFEDVWGISRLRFEVFTFGTLAVIIAFAVVGYWLGRPVRERTAEVALAGEPASAEWR